MQQITQNNITLGERITAPTPKIFKTLRWIGISLISAATIIVAAPVAPIVITVATYLGVAGTVATAVSSVAVDFDKLNAQREKTLNQFDSIK